MNVQEGGLSQGNELDLSNPEIQCEARNAEPIGQRLRALFSDIGLEEDIPERRGHPAKPAALR